MSRRFTLGVVLVAGLLVVGCAAQQAFRAGDAAARAGNLDQAVTDYRRALQADPNNAAYRFALERAMMAAGLAHLTRARDFEDHDQLEAALGEYRAAAEFD